MKALHFLRKCTASLLLSFCLLFGATGRVSAAINQIPTPSPGAGSYGIEATKPQPPPKVGATITVPGSGASLSQSPITVSGICPDGLLVEVYNNGVMAGSVDCKGGSFSVQVTLYVGQNDLTAIVYDDLDQAGPVSNTVTVTYSNASFTSFGTVMTLTSTYGRRAADPGAQLNWPVILSGGTGPYAFSIDWGDGGAAELKSQAAAGTVGLSHVYKNAGVYHIIVKVTDATGTYAFLQLVGVANGKVAAENTTAATTKTVVVNKVLWIPLIVTMIMLFPTYWLGRKSQLYSLNRKMQKSFENYKEL